MGVSLLGVADGGKKLRWDAFDVYRVSAGGEIMTQAGAFTPPWIRRSEGHMGESPHSIPTAPGRLPLVGHLPGLSRDLLGFITALREAAEHGLVRVYVGTTPMYVVTAYEPADDILAARTHALGVGRMFRQLGPLIGDSLATLEGPAHLRRRLIHPPFRAGEIPGYAGAITRLARDLSGSFKPREPVRVDRALYRLTLTATAEALFSVGLAGPVVAEVDRSLPVVTNGVALRAFLPRGFERLPLPLNRRYDLAVRRLRHAIQSAIDQHRAASPTSRNLLSALQENRDPDSGEGLTDGQIRDEIITIMLAGTDTPASVLSWTLYELARHPEVEHRLHAELDTVLAGRPAEISDVARLPYTGQVLTEANRLYSALLLMRATATPTTLAGERLPPGTDILLSPYVIHRDPRFFDDRFDPGRWEPGRAHHIPRKAYLPFGAGPHKCIGDALAWAELVIVLATLCSRWRLRLAPGHPVTAVPSVVPRPDNLLMIPEPRT
ncbi:cytochrome P450 [Nonomuraea angiospora]|uniref:cytochrome P450 n=1 Tax=Nonomuraea angiospora TaxID=46172 RepID=UPI0033CB30CF